MQEIVLSGGWMMLPILVCSGVALAIVVERFWTLRPARLAPPELSSQVRGSWQKGKVDRQYLAALRETSALGRVLAAGLASGDAERDIMKERIEEAASQEIHDMERFLNTLGTIAAITPLLGLLGTVIGMIDVFSAIMIHGTGDAARLAGGISQALITTAAGLTVAIPAIFFHRFFVRRVDEITIGMEQAAVQLLDWVHGEGSASPGAPQDAPRAAASPRRRAAKARTPKSDVAQDGAAS
ncbi:MotA/TolQ/ExbB proton channel family protein [Alcanivorax sp. JB21]|uniref:MotA/TolQ/ExbB proton channel family protein n=1 Tax=Alcanivorax limicola TaxID=2874102 RepID=UPI001CBC4693|nr:MotA/TolQ/ExbB proton channel family protein [Alcanivorax limicola]MBZ2188019.1 MotA/TolQ/ExbB proton channel family protein [Alcanivorax limicola]